MKLRVLNWRLIFRNEAHVNPTEKVDLEDPVTTVEPQNVDDFLFNKKRN